jgi:hypothetical protein
MPVAQFEYVDERTLSGAGGTQFDVLDAVQQLPWVRQLRAFMPHDYAIRRNSPEQAWYVVEAMIRMSPKSYRAFFRGYQSTNRYWHAPDGRRYWRSRFELDRWDAWDTEGLRRRDAGAHAIKDWDGPRWAPNGAGYYVRAPTGSGGQARSSSPRDRSVPSVPQAAGRSAAVNGRGK